MDQQKETAKRMGRLHSRFSLLRRPGKSPNPKNEKLKNTPLANTANSVVIEAPPDDGNDAGQGVNTATADPTNDFDMWAIAERELREDPQKREKLDRYDKILEDHFKSKLEPIGTPKRREQFREFFESEVKNLTSIDSETRLQGCKNKAKRFLKAAVDCVLATRDIIAAASAPCLPASVACAGVTFLLSVS